jgi:hypothetical protein
MILPIWLWIVSLLAVVGVGATVATVSVQNRRTHVPQNNTVVNTAIPTASNSPVSNVVVPRTIPRTTSPSNGISQQRVPGEINYNGTTTPYGQGASQP